MSDNGNPTTANFSHLKVVRGKLVEYTESKTPLTLSFEFNPSTITRSRSIEISFGEGQQTTGGKDFRNVSESTRAAQGATVKAESFTVKILLDATDRMNEPEFKDDKNNQVQKPLAPKDKEVYLTGIQPEMDILYSMVEPKLQEPGGAATLAALSRNGGDKQPYPSVLLFHWGEQVMPVFMTQVQFEVKAYLPSLVPYRAEATLTLQVIQSRNEFYTAEIQRMFNSAKKAVGAK